MTRRISTGAIASVLAGLLVALSLVLTVMAVSTTPTLAFASTGGDTELTIQQSTDSKTPGNDEKKSDDDQTRTTVTSSKDKSSGGGSLAKTGDDTLPVPFALIATGCTLTLLGAAARMWSTRRRPPHHRAGRHLVPSKGGEDT